MIEVEVDILMWSDALRIWCVKNTPSYRTYRYSFTKMIYYVSFENEIDAILFRLKWL